MTHQTLAYIKEKVGSPNGNGHGSHSNGHTHSSLTTKFDIDEDNLKIRRAFLHLGEEERKICIDLLPWMEEHAPKIVREFYDWQFNFPPTVKFFEHMAAEKGMTLVNLRVHLEKAQQGYLTSCLTGARENWGVAYFESRLKIGAVHHRINLPFKWYIGSYTEFSEIIHKYLKSSFEDVSHIDKVLQTFTKIFNYDTQAIVESTIFNAIESFGFPFETIKTTADTDRGDHLDQINSYLVQKQIEAADQKGQIEAINKTMAVIEFELDGTITYANQNLLDAMGYSEEDVLGNKHMMFCDQSLVESPEYRTFWDELRKGNSQVGEFKRLSRLGQEVWLQASYNVITGPDGTPLKVVKYATDITEQKIKNLDFEGQLSAISRSQAVVEFSMEGNILKANDNFAKLMKCRMDDIMGQHHSDFLPSDYVNSDEFSGLWNALNRGEGQIGEYRHRTRSGQEIWLQASFNPLPDADGNPFKVVMYASDITEQVQAQVRLQESVDTILDVVDAAAQGDLTNELLIEGEDAIGKLGSGLSSFLNKLKEIISQIDENAQMLAAASDELSAVSDNMGNTAGETSSQASAVATAAEEVSTNIQTVAAGAEEMTASIKEVATNAGEAARVANEAVEAAETTNITVTKLGESSAEIGNVIKVITSIAQQTNLLALNATIEAARAGEAGKGFAVVANEVKELAKQTAQATEEISQKIEAIQTDTKGAVEAISHISSVIGQINDIQGTIAAAVEEQSTTTSEIARNVHEAANGSTEIAENISRVALAADNTASGAKESKTATEELTRMSTTLRGIVAMFRY